MTVKQAAQALGVSRWRIYALIREGQLEGQTRKAPGTDWEMVILKRADVERLAEERRRIVAGELPRRGGTLPNVPPEGKP